ICVRAPWSAVSRALMAGSCVILGIAPLCSSRVSRAGPSGEGPGPDPASCGGGRTEREARAAAGTLQPAIVEKDAQKRDETATRKDAQDRGHTAARRRTGAPRRQSSQKTRKSVTKQRT